MRQEHTTQFELPYLLEGFLLAQRAQGNSPNTVKFYTWNLRRFLWFLGEGNYPLSYPELEPRHIRLFFAYLQETATNRWGSSHPAAQRPLSSGGVHGFARAVRAFLHWCSTETGLPCPFDGVVMPNLPDPFRVETYTEEEVARIFEAVDRSASTPFMQARNRAALALLLDTGIRAGELLALTVTSLNPAERGFTVMGKGRKERYVALGQRARAEVWRYLHHFRLPFVTDYPHLFITWRGYPLKYDGLKGVFKLVRRYSGIERVSVRAHNCRHTAATLMHRNGMRGATLQEQMGHTKFDTTRKYYLDIPPQQLEDEHERYGPLDKIKALDVKSERKRGMVGERVLPPAGDLYRQVMAEGYRPVSRRYGVSDTTVRNRLRDAGLI